MTINGGSLAKGGTATFTLTGLPAGATLVASSVAVTSVPGGSNGEQAIGQAGSRIAVTAPTNKTGSMVIAFTYVVNGVTVTGNTLTVAIV